MEIAFEDKVLLVVKKPCGLPTQNTKNPEKENLYDLAKAHLKNRQTPHNYLALHHRLDAASSGLVLFCKNPKYNKYVTDLFRDKKIGKKYLALVDVLKEENLQVCWITENKIKSYQHRHFKKACIASNGKVAITEFRLLERIGNRALLECTPLTGRLHQIRVQLAKLGLPIVGDFHYHPKKQQGELMLHASELSLRHPASRKLIKIEDPNSSRLEDVLEASSPNQ